MTEDTIKMTHDEMIDVLKGLVFGTFDRTTAKEREALDMAIELLEQEPCEDAIIRQAVLDGIDTYINKAQSTGTQDDFYSFAELVVKELPSVTPKPKTGHWVVHPKGIYAHLVCDKCLSSAPYDCRTNYCPNCGAKMEIKE